MTPADREAIIAVIKQTVNGKIDRIEEKIDRHYEKHEEDMAEVKGHIEEVKPILDAYNGGKVLGSFAKWLAGVGLAVFAILSWFK